jgi:hypothetical protein
LSLSLPLYAQELDRNDADVMLMSGFVGFLGFFRSPGEKVFRESNLNRIVFCLSEGKKPEKPEKPS